VKINIDTSVSDVIDRFSILKIKEKNGLNVRLELSLYEPIVQDLEKVGFERYSQLLLLLNEQMWDLEDQKRKTTDRYSVAYANISELITQLNDLRAATKRKCDDYFRSEIREKKSHQDLVE
jgi:hypothetical protein